MATSAEAKGTRVRITPTSAHWRASETRTFPLLRSHQSTHQVATTAPTWTGYDKCASA
jgi:hypothetical protein